MFLRIELRSKNSTIRNRLLLQVIHFRKCSIRSSGIPELLFYTKKSYRILQLQLQLQFYKGTHTTYKLHAASTPTRAHPENSPSRNPILHAEDKELFEYYYYTTDSRNSTHRRQGDLLEMHPCVLQDLPVTFQAFQP